MRICTNVCLPTLCTRKGKNISRVLKRLESLPSNFPKHPKTFQFLYRTVASRAAMNRWWRNDRIAYCTVAIVNANTRAAPNVHREPPDSVLHTVVVGDARFRVAIKAHGTSFSVPRESCLICFFCEYAFNIHATIMLIHLLLFSSSL